MGGEEGWKMSTKRVRVLLADDHGLVAAGVSELLESRYEVVGIVDNGQALLEAATARRPDVILTDIAMPGLDGLEATRRLRLSLPEVPVIVLTMLDGAGHVKAAFEAGAAGYLVKSSAPRELFDAIEEVLAGRRYVTSAVAGKVMGSLLSPEPAAPESVLTRREIEISGLVAEGLENVEIADHLCIAQVTVRTHFHNILRKLDLRNRVELARHALDQGWASHDASTDGGEDRSRRPGFSR
jgi:DNA-binding NarL/FixJ family response regulator